MRRDTSERMRRTACSWIRIIYSNYGDETNAGEVAYVKHRLRLGEADRGMLLIMLC